MNSLRFKQSLLAGALALSFGHAMAQSVVDAAIGGVVTDPPLTTGVVEVASPGTTGTTGTTGAVDPAATGTTATGGTTTGTTGAATVPAVAAVAAAAAAQVLRRAPAC